MVGKGLMAPTLATTIKVAIKASMPWGEVLGTRLYIQIRALQQKIVTVQARYRIASGYTMLVDNKLGSMYVHVVRY